MKRERLLTLLGSVCLAVMLLVPLAVSCGPATPEEAAEEIAALEAEIADLEGDVAAEKAKISGLEAEIAELRAPAEKLKIIYTVYDTSGPNFDAAGYVIDTLETASEGRIKVTLLMGEGPCPYEEYLEATRDGAFDLCETYPNMYAEKLPVLLVSGGIPGTLRDAFDQWALFEYRGLGEIEDAEYAKWNIKRIHACGYNSEMIVSKVPIAHATDLKGLKVRTVPPLDKAFAALDAGVVFIPGDEIYTGLASGLIDAATYDNPAIMYSMGFNEVTKYWILPSINPCAGIAFWANMDFWNKLSAMDKALLQNTCFVAGTRLDRQGFYESQEAIEKIQQEGLKVQYWNDEDLKMWSEAMVSTLPTAPEDPALAKALDIMFDYMKWRGYID